MFDIDDLPAIVEEYRNRYVRRDLRHEKIHEIITGDWTIEDGDEDTVEKATANLIQVAIEDTGDAAAVMPSVRVKPWKNTESAKAIAAKQERIAGHYTRMNKLSRKLSPMTQKMAAYGLCPVVVWPEFEQLYPVWEVRDPRGCWPEPGLRDGERARNVLFARQVPLTTLPKAHQQLIMAEAQIARDLEWRKQQKITLVEYFDENEIVVGALITAGGTYASIDSSSRRITKPIELSRVVHAMGVCPVVIGERPRTDSEQRGQFDQVIGPQKAWARLQALLLDYADQQVYSDVWVKDAIGEVSFGGGAYIQLGPNGGIGRVPPATSSFQVNQDLDNAEQAIHTGGRWPKQRPGQVDQSIASAKFVEATAGMMNTVLKAYHLELAEMVSSLCQISFITDQKILGERADGPRTAYGVLRNQEFAVDYTTKDIDLRNQVYVDYGLGLGKDPSQAAVLHIQYAQNEYISHEFVQESIEGVHDVARERARIDAQKLRAIMFGKLIEMAQTGQMTNEQLLEMLRRRYEGQSMDELFEEYVVKPEKEMLGLPTSGLTGMPIGGPPGVVPPGGPAQPPGVPPAPNPTDLLSRINVPAGPGGTLGAQTLEQPGG